LITGLILTDEGSSVTEQLSKLWSSAHKFYWYRAPNTTTTMNINLNNVQQSVQAFLQESNVGTSQKSQHKSSKPNLSRSLNGTQPGTLPCNTSFIALPEPLNGWANRALAAVIAIETSACEIGATLSFEYDNPLEDAIL
jgi:hypothetical protein